MDVIGHSDEGIEFDGREPPGKFTPYRPDSIASTIAFHFVIGDAAEDGFMAHHAEGEEIMARLGVVVSREANRMAGGSGVNGHAGIIY